MSCLRVHASSASTHSLRARTRARGVAVIEVLNFATLALVIGAVAVAVVARYMRHARTAEATGALTAIGSGAVAAFDGSDANEPQSSGHASRRFPTSARESVPSDPTTLSGRKYQSARYEWDTVPWRELQFSMTQAQSYAYNFTSTGVGASASATAEAKGDLDGDRTFSSYKLQILPDPSLNAHAAALIDIDDGDE